MIYYRKPMEVDAIKLQVQMNLAGKVGNPGDYLVTFKDGSMTIVSGPTFEASFDAVPAQVIQFPAQVQKPPQMEQPIPKPLGFVCVGCGSETVPEREFDKNTGMCAACLKQTATCQTCGATVQQFEIVGTYCRRCLTNKA